MRSDTLCVYVLYYFSWKEYRSRVKLNNIKFPNFDFTPNVIVRPTIACLMPLYIGKTSMGSRPLTDDMLTTTAGSSLPLFFPMCSKDSKMPRITPFCKKKNTNTVSVQVGKFAVRKLTDKHREIIRQDCRFPSDNGVCSSASLQQRIHRLTVLTSTVDIFQPFMNANGCFTFRIQEFNYGTLSNTSVSATLQEDAMLT